jgi:hypothetical protein
MRASASSGHSTISSSALGIRSRVDADRVPAEQSRRGAQCLGRVDGTDDDEPGRRAVDLREDLHVLDLVHAVAPNPRCERGERRGRVADGLVAVE